MRKRLSVLMLPARSTICPMLAIFALIAALDTAAFYAAIYRGDYWGLEGLISESGMPQIALGGFLLLCVALSLPGAGYGGSKCGYTLKRLAVSEREATLWFALYYAACFFMLWALQTLMAFLLCGAYVAQALPETVSGQTIFLASYRSSFLHSLLPLAETSRWVRNMLLLPGLGICTACFAYSQREGGKGLSLILLAVTVAIEFSKPVGSFGTDLFVCIMTLSCTGAALYRLFGGGDEDEDLY